MSGATKSLEVRLKNWPTGIPSPDDFEVAETSVGPIENGQVLVRNLYMSVDPYMRGRLRPGRSYVSAFEIGRPLSGGCVGIIEDSKSAELPAGACVLGGMGFREYFVSDAATLVRIDPGSTPASAYLGVLGMPGRTAYVGLLKIGNIASGETVFVSAAAGAVGSAACQIARIKGCTVVGSTGSERKIAWLIENEAVDSCFSYRDFANIGRELRRQCPDGIDVYFDNVGGTHLEAALENMNDFGRIVSCGMISRYNDVEPSPGPSNLFHMISKRLRMQGFIVSDHRDSSSDFDRDMKKWIADGSIKWTETVVVGIDRAADALIGLFTGENIGKMIVKLSD